MVQLFNTVLYQPIFNFLVFLYNVIPGHDIGIAIIILTIVIKLILLPLSIQATKSQKALQDLQPKMKKIKNQYKDNKQKQSAALMELYKNEKVNPLSSCFPMIIQLPFLIAVFSVFRNGFKPESLNMVYSFIQRPESLNPIAFGVVDLSNRVILFAFLAGAAQYWQSKMLIVKKQPIKSEGAKDENMMAMMNKQMVYLMPLMTVFIGFTLPGGLTLYWFLTTLFMVFQQKIMFKNKT